MNSEKSAMGKYSIEIWAAANQNDSLVWNRHE